MQILLSSDHHGGIGDVQNWLDFNEIDHHYHTLYDQSDGVLHIDSGIENSILVCNYAMLIDLVNQTDATSVLVEEFIRFSQKNNRLWIVGWDVADACLRSELRAFLIEIDSKIHKDTITLFLDAQPTLGCFLAHLHNIKCQVMKVNYCGRELPRCQAPSMTKTSARYAYMLTMMLKRSKPYRNKLWKQLNQRSGLANQGLMMINRSSDMGHGWTKWSGRINKLFPNYQYSHASMDFYLDCWLEIVVESYYKDLYMMTEKTVKPFKTRTPFLVCSTAGYLSWLRQQGFQTFGSLIDESYDQHYRVEDRIAGMLDVLEDIIGNGAASFYEASRPILDHNFSRLCEMSGSWDVQFDDMMWQALQAAQSR